MAKANAITFRQFRERYNTEEACRAELFRLRFPKGFVCPKCGCREYYPIQSKKSCQCRNCRHQTSVTAGTVMHRTHLPLTTWFWAIYLCANDKRGISAIQLSNFLEICYDTAWHLLDKIRAAMGQRDSLYTLSGLIEMDDGYLGGPGNNGKRGRGAKETKLLVALSKTEDNVPMFAHMKLVKDIKTKTLQEFVDNHLTKGATVVCDGFQSYISLNGVTCCPKKYDATDEDLKWLHKAISNLKAFLQGTYHGRCTKLQAYLDEYCFRFNRRMSKNQLFSRLARAVATSCVLLT